MLARRMSFSSLFLSDLIVHSTFFPLFLSLSLFLQIDDDDSVNI